MRAPASASRRAPAWRALTTPRRRRPEGRRPAPRRLRRRRPRAARPCGCRSSRAAHADRTRTDRRGSPRVPPWPEGSRSVDPVPIRGPCIRWYGFPHHRRIRISPGSNRRVTAPRRTRRTGSGASRPGPARTRTRSGWCWTTRRAPARRRSSPRGCPRSDPPWRTVCRRSSSP